MSALYPAYSNINVRILSFKTFPKILRSVGDNLALAGFFYLGSSDLCCCFSCGLVVDNILITATAEYVRALHLCRRLECEYSLNSPLSIFFLKHVALVEFKTHRSIFPYLCKKERNFNRSLSRYFNVLKSNIEIHLYNKLPHQIILYFTNDNCSHIMLPTPNFHTTPTPARAFGCDPATNLKQQSRLCAATYNVPKTLNKDHVFIDSDHPPVIPATPQTLNDHNAYHKPLLL